MGARKTSKSGYDFSKDNITGIMPILSPLTYIYTKDYDSQMSLTEYKYMTLQRYYENNRGISNSSWAVLSSSDNILLPAFVYIFQFFLFILISPFYFFYTFLL